MSARHPAPVADAADRPLGSPVGAPGAATRSTSGSSRSPSGSPHSPSRSTTRDLVLASVAFFAVLAAWALANPLMAAPDEPAHATKASAVVRGQLLGEDLDPDVPGAESVRVPTLFEHVVHLPECFAFRSDVTARCVPDPPRDYTRPTTTSSTAVSYNPTYYVLVGVPSLVPTGLWTLYAMRLVSAALCAVALAWAVAQALSVRGGRWVALGTLLAVTPMVAFLGSTINPAALEIAVALALWVSLSVVIRDPDRTRLGRRMAAIAVLAAVFVNLRGLSPLFLAIIVLACVASAPWALSLRVLRTRSTWRWLGVVAVASVLALAWTRGAGSLETDGAVNHPTLDFRTAALWSLGDTSAYLENMIGEFGWVDTDLPLWLLMLVALTTGTCVLLGLALAGTRQRVVMLVLATLIVVLPVVIHASQALYLGIIWQGRYFLPAAVGMPVLAALAGAAPLARAHRFRRRVVVVLGGAWVLSGVVAFGANLHRYAQGTDVGLLEAAPDPWSPPVPAVLLGAVLVAGLVALVGMCLPRAQDEAADEATVGPAAGLTREPTHEPRLDVGVGSDPPGRGRR